MNLTPLAASHQMEAPDPSAKRQQNCQRENPHMTSAVIFREPLKGGSRTRLNLHFFLFSCCFLTIHEADCPGSSKTKENLWKALFTLCDCGMKKKFLCNFFMQFHKSWDKLIIFPVNRENHSQNLGSTCWCSGAPWQGSFKRVVMWVIRE